MPPLGCPGLVERAVSCSSHRGEQAVSGGYSSNVRSDHSLWKLVTAIPDKSGDGFFVWCKSQSCGDVLCIFHLLAFQEIPVTASLPAKIP